MDEDNMDGTMILGDNHDDDNDNDDAIKGEEGADRLDLYQSLFDLNTVKEADLLSTSSLSSTTTSPPKFIKRLIRKPKTILKGTHIEVIDEVFAVYEEQLPSSTSSSALRYNNKGHDVSLPFFRGTGDDRFKMYPSMPMLRLEVLDREYEEPVRDRDKNWALQSQRPVLDGPTGCQELDDVLPSWKRHHRNNCQNAEDGDTVDVIDVGSYADNAPETTTKKPNQVESLQWSSSFQSMIRKSRLFRQASTISETPCIVNVYGIGITGRIFSDGGGENRMLIIEAYSIWNSQVYSIVLNMVQIKIYLAWKPSLFLPGHKNELLETLLKQLYFEYDVTIYPIRKVRAAAEEGKESDDSTIGSDSNVPFQSTVIHLKAPIGPPIGPKTVGDVIRGIMDPGTLPVGMPLPKLTQTLKIADHALINGATKRRRDFEINRAKAAEEFERKRREWLAIPKRHRGLVVSSLIRSMGRFVMVSAYRMPSRPQLFVARGLVAEECAKLDITLTLSLMATFFPNAPASKYWDAKDVQYYGLKLLHRMRLNGDPVLPYLQFIVQACTGSGVGMKGLQKAHVSRDNFKRNLSAKALLQVNLLDDGFEEFDAAVRSGQSNMDAWIEAYILNSAPIPAFQDLTTPVVSPRGLGRLRSRIGSADENVSLTPRPISASKESIYPVDESMAATAHGDSQVEYADNEPNQIKASTEYIQNVEDESYTQVSEPVPPQESNEECAHVVSTTVVQLTGRRDIVAEVNIKNEPSPRASADDALVSNNIEDTNISDVVASMEEEKPDRTAESLVSENVLATENGNSILDETLLEKIETSLGEEVNAPITSEVGEVEHVSGNNGQAPVSDAPETPSAPDSTLITGNAPQVAVVISTIQSPVEEQIILPLACQPYPFPDPPRWQAVSNALRPIPFSARSSHRPFRCINSPWGIELTTRSISIGGVPIIYSFFLKANLIHRQPFDSYIKQWYHIDEQLQAEAHRQKQLEEEADRKAAEKLAQQMNSLDDLLFGDNDDDEPLEDEEPVDEGQSNAPKLNAEDELRTDLFDTIEPSLRVDIRMYFPHGGRPLHLEIAPRSMQMVSLSKEDLFRMIDDRELLLKALGVCFQSFYVSANCAEVDDMREKWYNIAFNIMKKAEWIRVPVFNPVIDDGQQYEEEVAVDAVVEVVDSNNEDDENLDRDDEVEESNEQGEEENCPVEKQEPQEIIKKPQLPPVSTLEKLALLKLREQLCADSASYLLSKSIENGTKQAKGIADCPATPSSMGLNPLATELWQDCGHFINRPASLLDESCTSSAFPDSIYPSYVPRIGWQSCIYRKNCRVNFRGPNGAVTKKFLQVMVWQRGEKLGITAYDLYDRPIPDYLLPVSNVSANNDGGAVMCQEDTTSIQELKGPDPYSRLRENIEKVQSMRLLACQSVHLGFIHAVLPSDEQQGATIKALRFLSPTNRSITLGMWLNMELEYYQETVSLASLDAAAKVKEEKDRLAAIEAAILEEARRKQEEEDNKTDSDWGDLDSGEEDEDEHKSSPAHGLKPDSIDGESVASNASANSLPSQSQPLPHDEEQNEVTNVEILEEEAETKSEHDSDYYDKKITLRGIRMVEATVDLDMNITDVDYDAQAAEALKGAEEAMADRVAKTKEAGLAGKRERAEEEAKEAAKRRLLQEEEDVRLGLKSGKE